MKIVNNIKNFLQDKEYYIDIFDNKLHAFNYAKLLKLSDSEIYLKFEKFLLKINGNNLKIRQMDNVEILISGEINSMRFEK